MLRRSPAAVVALGVHDAGPQTSCVTRESATTLGEAWVLARPLGSAQRARHLGGLLDQWEALATLAAHDVDDTRDPHALAHLGAIDEVLQSSRRALAEAAALSTDAHVATTADAKAVARLTAKRVRATMARAVDEIVHRASRVLGPAPLALEADYVKRVADLQLYVRQHHAERDLASLGTALVGERAPW